MNPRVLIVDDDRERLALLSQVLADGFECTTVDTLDAAVQALGEGGWAAALVDYNLIPTGSGLEVLQAFRELSPVTLRILYSGHFSQGLRHDAVRLARAHDVLDARETGFAVRLRESLERLIANSPAPEPEAAGIPLSGRTALWCARSAVTLKFLAALRRAAECPGPVFLHGEPGTGKRLAASLLQEWRREWRERGGGPAAGESGPAVVLEAPPLRERRGDLPGLAQQSLERIAGRLGEPVKRLSPDALEELAGRAWIGNVRELQALLLRAWRRSGARGEITAADLPKDVEPGPSPSHYAKDAAQRDAVLRQLRVARSVLGAARLEGVTRPNYMRMMHRLGVIRADTLPAEESGEGGD